jgi:hypothetical protein
MREEPNRTHHGMRHCLGRIRRCLLRLELSRSIQASKRKSEPAAADDGRHTTIAYIQDRRKPERAGQYLGGYAANRCQGQVEQKLSTPCAVEQEEQEAVKPRDQECQSDRRRNCEQLRTNGTDSSVSVAGRQALRDAVS